MKVSLKNIGCFSDSTIECNGLTVICGINGTGKSTILKSIYVALCPAMYFDFFRDDQIQETLLTLAFRHLENGDSRRIKSAKSDEDYIQILKDLDDAIGEDEQDRKPLEYVKTLLDSTEEGDNTFYKAVLQSRINSEFDGIDQFKTIESGDSASIELDGDLSITLEVSVDGKITFKGDRKKIPNVVYMDSPFNIDNGFWPTAVFGNHRSDVSHLINTMSNPNVILRQSFETNVQKFDEAVETIIDGRFINTKQGLKYESTDGRLLSVLNIAAGIKVFATIRMLVDKGVLYEGSILMLDEPESHLHPQWINILGDVIAILVRDLRLKVILTTHSPQLLMAIESSVKDIQKDVRYYNIHTDDGMSVIDEVGDRIEQIYDEMSKPINEVASRFWE